MTLITFQLSFYQNKLEKIKEFSTISGAFKGYGFASFNSKVAALQARHVLDGQEVGGHLLDSGEKVGGHLVECGWLKEGTHKLSDLQSKVCYENCEN